VEKFAELMNETTKKLGCKNFNCTNPHGLHDDSHYCSALDLGKISVTAMRNETFKEISSTKTIKVANETQNYPKSAAQQEEQAAQLHVQLNRH